MQTDIVQDALQETLSGIMSQQRAQVRARGTTHLTFRASIPLTDILQRVVSRLMGLYDDQYMLPDLPTIRCKLQELGIAMVGDCVELAINLPPSRPAHAR